jgi:hypothetical protein
MNKPHNPDANDQAFKPPHFLFYYMQRIFIWGEWSIAQARYFHRRELLRFRQQQAQNGMRSSDNR